MKCMPSDSRSRQHFDVEQKCAAVRRVLGGENANRVAAELQVSRDRLERWEHYFLEGGRQGVAKYHDRTRTGKIRWRKVLPWGGLMLVLIVIVYIGSRYFQALEP